MAFRPWKTANIQEAKAPALNPLNSTTYVLLFALGVNDILIKIQWQRLL